MAKLRKIFTISVMLVTVLSMSVVVAPNVDAAASGGDLIKMDGLSSVYYLGADGKRYVFPNEQTYFSWYSDFSGVVTIPQSELESYPLGANVTIRPGTKLVKITTNPKVYAVEADGSLVAIPDEATAATLYGTDWAKRVVDVPDAFFTNYTVGTGTVSATTYPGGSLIKTTDSVNVYYVNADGLVSKIASEAAMLANRFKNSDIITVASTFVMPATTADITAADSDITDTSRGGGSGTGITPGAGTGLTVAIASDTAASASLPAGASGVAFTKVNFTAANDGDVTVKNLVVTRIGIGAASDFAGVWIYDADGNRLTSSRTVSSSSNTATFSGINYLIAAGTTKALIVKATGSATGTSGNNGFAINSASAITTNGAAVSGSFPISGNLMSMTSVAAGSIAYTLSAVENTSLKVGDLQKEVADLKLTAGSGEDITFHSIALTNNGTADANDLKNFKLYQGSTLVAEVASVTSDRLMLTLTTPLVITKSANKNFSLKADIMGGVATSGSIVYVVDDLTDIIAVGNSYGFGVAVSGSGSSSIAVAAGEFTIEIDGPAAYDVTADADDVVLANMTFTTGGDEAIEIKTFYAHVLGTASTSVDNLSMSSAVENVQLVNVDSGDYYDVSGDDAVSTDNTYYFKVSDFTVPAGSSNWRVEADLISTKVASGDKFAFGVYAGADIALGGAVSTSGNQGIEAKNLAGKVLDDIKPGALIQGNNVTVQTASLAVTNVGLSAGSAVAKTKGVELIRFSAKAGSSEAIKMTQVALVGTTTTAVLTDASNYTLLASDGTVLQSGISAVDGVAAVDTVTFSGLTNGGYSIPKGETKTFYVTADINSTVVSTMVSVAIGANGVTAEDSSGDALATTAVTGDTLVTDVVGRNVTLYTKGTIAFTVDNSSPVNGHILLTSSENNSILKFKADASYEDITLKDLRFKVTGTGDNATTSIASLELWQDGTFVSEVTTDGAYGYVFSGLENIGTAGVTVLKDTDSIFELKLNVAGIGDAAQDTASSGANIIVTLLPTSTGVVARGASSNNDLVTGDITNSNIASQDNYVYASKVTATKATSQPSTLSTGLKEVLKFTLTPSGNDNKNASLTNFDVTFNFTGNAATTTSIAYLYTGSTLLATSTIVSTNSSTATANDFTAPTTGATWSDEISASGETYTVKIDAWTDGTDDQITTSFTINGGRGNDQITWNDGADSTGSVGWIDLAEGSDTTLIENTIRSN